MQAWLVELYYKFSTRQAGLKKRSLVAVGHASARFSYSEKGSRVSGKPSIVFVHGLSSNKETWIPIIKCLAQNHHCITVDLPGHGETVGHNEDGYSILKFVEKLKLFFDTLGMTEPMCIVGASMGGSVVTMFAIKYPEYVSMICLLAPPTIEEYDTELIRKLKSGDSTALIPETPQQLRSMINTLTVKRMSLPQFFVNGLLVLRLRLLEEHKRVLTHILEEEAKIRDDMYGQLANLKCPALIVWGNQDKVFSSGAANHLCEVMPNAKSVLFDECGHFMAIDKPREVAENINSFYLENIHSITLTNFDM